MARKETTPLVSIVVPVFNEAAGIVWFHNTLTSYLKKQSGFLFEIIYVNDGSSDTSQSLLEELQFEGAVTVLELSRNFGKEAALSAGIAASTGDGVLSIDADGQYPIDYIAEFLEKWRAGADVVIGVRGKNQNEGAVKRYGSKAFYSIFNRFSEAEMVPKSTDFRLIDRKVVTEFNKLKENNRITRGLIDWLGFHRDYVYFDANERKFGNAGYSTKKLVQLAMNSFVSLSTGPLYFSGYLGLIFMALSLFVGIFVLVEQLILGDPLSLKITGTAVLGILIMFLVGVVLSAQGLIGLYIARVLGESQGRPLYVVRQTTKR